MAARPTSGHVAHYRAGAVPSEADGRLYSGVFENNSPPLIAAFERLIGNRRGPVLEIGSGTGQHAGTMALTFPGLNWWASDPDAVHRASIAAWAAFWNAPVQGPLTLDAAGDWANDAGVAALGRLTAVLAMNVAHITPLAVTRGIVAGAGTTLADGGVLIFTGPFRVDGVHIGPGNARFDELLRADNPDWGLRDTDEIDRMAAAAGLRREDPMVMPANNRLLIYRRP